RSGCSLSGGAAAGPPRRGARPRQIPGSAPHSADVTRVCLSSPYVRPLVRVYPDGQACEVALFPDSWLRFYKITAGIIYPCIMTQTQFGCARAGQAHVSGMWALLELIQETTQLGTRDFVGVFRIDALHHEQAMVPMLLGCQQVSSFPLRDTEVFQRYRMPKPFAQSPMDV